MRRKGFTLVELLVVVAIIALLISILAPSLKSAKDLAKQVICSTNIHGVGLATSLYADSNRGMIPPYCGQPKASGSVFVLGTMSYAPIYTAVLSGGRPEILDETFRLNAGVPYLDAAGKAVPWGPMGLLLYLGLVGKSDMLYCPAMSESQLSHHPYPEPYGTKTVGVYTGDTIKSSYPFNPNILTRPSDGLADYKYTKVEMFPSNAVLLSDTYIGDGSPHTVSGVTSPTWVRGFLGGSTSSRTSASLYTFLNTTGIDTWNIWADHLKALSYLQD